MSLVPLPLHVRSKIHFLQRVEGTACWLWPVCPDSHIAGGRITLNGQSIAAHRYVYQKMRGRLEVGQRLYRLCPTARCVNPNHMSLREKVSA